MTGTLCAIPTLDERNEGYMPPLFDSCGGKLGVTPILWEFRMAYEWSDWSAEENPEWDQCCTLWLFAVSEGEARAKVWDRFKTPGSVMPIAIASCHPKRFRNQRDDEKEARLASAMSARSGETEGLDPQDASATATPGRPDPIATHSQENSK